LEDFNHRWLFEALQEAFEINLGFVALEPVVTTDTSKLWATGKTLRSDNGDVKLQVDTFPNCIDYLQVCCF
jgi:hypothetical protein